jgi:hypothetical protein
MAEVSSVVWFVYDGDCPICNIAAQGLRISKAVGGLKTLNAREDRNHPIMQEIKQQRLSLDDGMVIKYEGDFYHGKDALHLMALLGSDSGWFNRMNAILFRYKILCSICYPPMRAVRNLLLLIKSIKPISNLVEPCKNMAPIFQPIFGERWKDMSILMLRRYANRPYSNDIIKAEGCLEISLVRFLAVIAPVLKWISPLPMFAGKDIPVTVFFESKLSSSACYLKRIFHLKNNKQFHFQSFMITTGGSEVIEYITPNIGCRLNYAYSNDKVVITHKCYVLKILDLTLPLPLTWLIGSVYAEETSISTSSFSMLMNITHPLFGRLYEYKGTFTIGQDDAK